ncbi:MAG: SufE family protein [Alphaproteobacteria bacterium]
MVTTRVEKLIEDFDILEDWEDRYRYVIDLGRTLPELAPADRIAQNKVSGCASQVWLTCAQTPPTGKAGPPVLVFSGDSDAHIVRGLIAILFALYEGKSAPEILSTDSAALLQTLGLDTHLSSQRANGLAAMDRRIRDFAQAKSAPNSKH